ncbi:DinB family protein [Cellulomonas sp. McL0617]|uniref:DinB family protein n=1 Tax=Cellulomonas sp. McL0617 TaxID=3415675 RepID=UPI003CF438F6
MGPRTDPFRAQFDQAADRLLARLAGPTMNSGDDDEVPVPPLTDDEYLWEPGPGCWTVRPRADGPGPGAAVLAGGGEWGRDGGWPRPSPPPFTTIAWRLSHLTEGLALRADHSVGTHALTPEEVEPQGTAAPAVDALRAATAAWRDVLERVTDDDLDTVGYSTFPHGSDPEDPFVDVVWWVNQELLHHGAEIALLRDLYRLLVVDRSATIEP